MEYELLEEWENILKKVFDEIDEALENRYGSRFPLHPARPFHGSTSSREQDGLFDVGASFSAGFGSKYGRGYVIDIDMVTLKSVPDDLKEQIERDVVRMLREKLPLYFPGRSLTVKRDGNIFKILGDLSFRSFRR